MSLTKIQRRALDRLSAGIDDGWMTLEQLAPAVPSYPRSRSLVLNTLVERGLILYRWEQAETKSYYRITDLGLEAIGQKNLLEIKA